MAVLQNEFFYCEHLTNSAEHISLVKTMKVKKRQGYGLENFLRNQAFVEENENKNKTYLVRDKISKELVAYFSLKAGLFSMENGFLWRKSITAIPGIELSNFAANDNYKDLHNDISGIGSIILSDFIFTIIKEIKEKIAVNSLYIFALPEDSLIRYYEKIGFTRLTKRAERQLHQRVKPSYDAGCVFMYQKI